MFVLHVVMSDWLKWISKLASPDRLCYLNTLSEQLNVRWVRIPLAPGTMSPSTLPVLYSSILQNSTVTSVGSSLISYDTSLLSLTYSFNCTFSPRNKENFNMKGKTGCIISWSLSLVVFCFLLTPLCKWTMYLNVSWVLVIPWLFNSNFFILDDTLHMNSTADGT